MFSTEPLPSFSTGSIISVFECASPLSPRKESTSARFDSFRLPLKYIASILDGTVDNVDMEESVEQSSGKQASTDANLHFSMIRRIFHLDAENDTRSHIIVLGTDAIARFLQSIYLKPSRCNYPSMH